MAGVQSSASEILQEVKQLVKKVELCRLQSEAIRQNRLKRRERLKNLYESRRKVIKKDACCQTDPSPPPVSPSKKQPSTTTKPFKKEDPTNKEKIVTFKIQTEPVKTEAISWKEPTVSQTSPSKIKCYYPGCVFDCCYFDSNYSTCKVHSSMSKLYPHSNPLFQRDESVRPPPSFTRSYSYDPKKSNAKTPLSLTQLAPSPSSSSSPSYLTLSIYKPKSEPTNSKSNLRTASYEFSKNYISSGKSSSSNKSATYGKSCNANSNKFGSGSSKTPSTSRSTKPVNWFKK